MRVNSIDYGTVSSMSGAVATMHWHNGGHNGGTCHGHPTPEACAENAIASGWNGKVLEREDVYEDGTKVKCYSLVTGSFEHYAKQGKFVVEVALTAIPIIE